MENLSFREKPRDRKAPLREAMAELKKKRKKEVIPPKKKKRGRKIQVWFNPKDLEILEQVQEYHQFSNPSATIKESLKRDFLNVAVKKEKIEEIRAIMDRYKIRIGEL